MCCVVCLLPTHKRRVHSGTRGATRWVHAHPRADCTVHGRTARTPDSPANPTVPAHTWGLRSPDVELPVVGQGGSVRATATDLAQHTCAKGGWCVMRGARCVVRCAWCDVRGVRCVVCGACCVVCGAQVMRWCARARARAGAGIDYGIEAGAGVGAGLTLGLTLGVGLGLGYLGFRRAPAYPSSGRVGRPHWSQNCESHPRPAAVERSGA